MKLPINKISRGKYFKKGVLLAIICTALDQLHKYIMLHEVQMIKPIEVTSFFNLVMVWNRGISFGMFNRPDMHEYQPLMLGLFAVLVVLILLNWLRTSQTALQMWGLALVIGGALGNVIDRILYGAVADFFDFYIGTYHWPAFNIADSFIFVGVLLLVADGISDIKKGKK